MYCAVLPGISEGELACATQQCHRYHLGGNLEGGAELSVSYGVLLECQLLPIVAASSAAG
jgi:hypothetical protein